MIKYLQADSTAAESLRYQHRLHVTVKNTGENLLYPAEKLVRNQSIGNGSGAVEISA